MVGEVTPKDVKDLLRFAKRLGVRRLRIGDIRAEFRDPPIQPGEWKGIGTDRLSGLKAWLPEPEPSKPEPAPEPVLSPEEAEAALKAAEEQLAEETKKDMYWSSGAS